MKTTTTCTKNFANLPFAHRQHNHDGHCALIHGHNWNFEITFSAERLDVNLFVIDFGKLKWVRKWLEENFDHTLVLNADDPMLDYLKVMLGGPVQCKGSDLCMAKIIVVPNCGAEGLALYVMQELNKMLKSQGIGQDRALVVSTVRAWEDEKNSATVSLTSGGAL